MLELRFTVNTLLYIPILSMTSDMSTSKLISNLMKLKLREPILQLLKAGELSPATGRYA